MAATSTAGATSSMCAALTAPRPSLRIRLGLENYGFRTPTFFSSGDPQVRDQEHCGGCCCERYLRGQCVHQLPTAQALRQAVLLCELRHPLQGCPQQVQGSQEGQNSTPQVRVPGPQATAGRTTKARSTRWCPKDVLRNKIVG